MNIDWSKAPEGAEYWCELQWFKTLDGEWRVWCPGVNSWVKPAYAAPDNFSWWGKAIKRPPTWNGEGLPPVWTVCEACYTSPDEYYQVKVLAHDDGKAVYRWLAGPGVGDISESDNQILAKVTGPHPKFRPIRTPEQIAAEEREKAVIEMLGLDPLGGSRRGLAEALYDHGYRKQEQTK